GYVVLYIALTLELIALPAPGEALMTYCGFLVFQGKLNWVISIIVAASGVVSGITISYFIGRALENTFFTKYGSYVHMGPDKLEKTSRWFEKYGNGLLFVAYFIPGVRHITGYFSGVTKIPYKRFAVNAYLGALLWTGTFISLGKVLGSNWEKFHVSIKKYLIIGGIIVGVVMICIYLYRSYKQQIVESVEKSLNYSFKIFRSLGRVRIAVAGVGVVFIAFVVLIAGLIQDFLANEFGQFDRISSYVMSQIFSGNWALLFRLAGFLTAYQVLIAVSALLLIWIMFKGKNRFLEVRFMIFTVLGGEFLEEILRPIFHRVGPFGVAVAEHTKYTFPSEQSLMALITFGFAAFIIIRYINRKWLGTIVVLFTLVICILSGLSPVFFNLQYPSDVAAGYVFGGAWLSMNIVLLEVFRILPGIENAVKTS
ncbi:MAG: VTT domain-containing protein, partial [Bacillota bacterium]|nr:VTT domain-containing protein [Bacillota bacterium]